MKGMEVVETFRSGRFCLYSIATHLLLPEFPISCWSVACSWDAIEAFHLYFHDVMPNSTCILGVSDKSRQMHAKSYV